MSTALSKELRYTIVQNLIIHKFAAERLTLLVEMRTLARQIRDEHLGKTHLDMLLALPDNWCEKVWRVRVQIAGEVIELNWSHRLEGQKTLGVEFLRFQPKLSDWTVLGVYDRGHPIAESFEDISGRWESHLDAVEHAKAQAEGALKGYRTVKALLAGWPEIKPFIPAEAFEKVALPVVQTAILNDIFGLPVDEVTA